MTDLSQKFIALENALTSRLDELVTAGNAQASGLQALAAALEGIAGCLCEEFAGGAGGEPDPELNDPPTTGCINYERIERVQSWQLQGETTIAGIAHKIWAPIFSYQADLQGWRPHITAESGRRAHVINQDYNPIFYCITWNFAGGTEPVQVYRLTQTAEYSTIANTTTGLALLPTYPVSFAENFSAPWLGPGNPAGTRYIQWPFVFPATVVTPPKNVWLRYPVQG
jgi:hypothetical protein